MIQIQHIRLRVVTSARMYGADIPLEPGLNVIQAHNTSGKSTALQAIIYAFGLERSLGPQLAIPLPYAMRERIHPAKDDEYEPVLQSYVEIELSDGHGTNLLIRRDVVGGKDTKLIQTWQLIRFLGGHTRTGQQRDFFVHDPGAAQREDGFHKYLVELLGWDLPIVPRFDGAEGPLYLEAIFPMLFVEQKRGWSTIQGPFPTFLKIQDVARRVMEFLLDLDVGRLRRQRAELRASIAAAEQKWAERRKNLDEQARKMGRIRGLPATPTAEFALTADIELEVFKEDQWLPIADVIAEHQSRLRELERAQTKPVEQAAPELQERLSIARNRVDSLSAILEATRQELVGEQQEQYALTVRLGSLASDLRRNQDALKLRKMGSDLGSAAGSHVCPTCHQDVTSELLPAIESVGMGLEENISFVKSQIDLYRVALETSNERIAEYQGRYAALQREAHERQAEIRNIRQSLVQPSSSPSRVSIEEIVRLSSTVDDLAAVQELAAGLADELQSIAREWARIQDLIRRLPADELSSSDKSKTTFVQTTVQNLIQKFGFVSFQPNEIVLSADNFRPLALTKDRDGELIEREIGFEISASDSIRLKWAYYLALLILSSTNDINHPGFVVFDEPGQQEVELPSLQSFLRSASEIGVSKNWQVILSTSEPIDAVRAVVGSQGHIVSFEGFLLQPL